MERIVNNNLYDQFNNLFSTFDFREYKIENFIVYIIYDMSDPWMSADFRMMIYFDNSKNIVGIANKGRALDLNNKFESTIDRGYRLQYINPLPDNKQKEFEEKMTKYFAGRD